MAVYIALFSIWSNEEIHPLIRALGFSITCILLALLKNKYAKNNDEKKGSTAISITIIGTVVLVVIVSIFDKIEMPLIELIFEFVQTVISQIAINAD